MVFFDVIINSQSSAGGGQEEWADIALTESVVGYKLEDIRVRGRRKKLLHVFLWFSSNNTWIISFSLMPCLTSLPMCHWSFRRGWTLCTGTWRGVFSSRQCWELLRRETATCWRTICGGSLSGPVWMCSSYSLSPSHRFTPYDASLMPQSGSAHSRANLLPAHFLNIISHLKIQH